jgi:CobQ-like glutamine amidotransferase family enzyme
MELAPSVKRKMAQFGHVVAGVGDLDQDGYEGVSSAWIFV